jgi:hypothetical protein
MITPSDDKEKQVELIGELSEEDKVHIMEVFTEEVVPRLMRMQARIGVLNCDFAGEEYKNWNIQFRSKGSGFEIVDFEYDVGSRSLSLDI